MGRPQTLDELQWMFNTIFSKKNTRDYQSGDLLLHVMEETAVVAEGLRKEDYKMIPTALAHFFGWLMALCSRYDFTLSVLVFKKYHDACPYCGVRSNCMCISNETKPPVFKSDPGGLMPRSLGDWQEMFDRIYGRINRVAGTERVWLHVHEELGEVSKAYRKNDRESLQEEIADIFAWLLSFCNRLEIDLAATVYKLYPGRCDVCKSRKCRCPAV